VGQNLAKCWRKFNKTSQQIKWPQAEPKLREKKQKAMLMPKQSKALPRPGDTSCGGAQCGFLVFVGLDLQLPACLGRALLLSAHVTSISVSLQLATGGPFSLPAASPNEPLACPIGAHKRRSSCSLKGRTKGRSEAHWLVGAPQPWAPVPVSSLQTPQLQTVPLQSRGKQANSLLPLAARVLQSCCKTAAKLPQSVLLHAKSAPIR